MICSPFLNFLQFIVYLDNDNIRQGLSHKHRMIFNFLDIFWMSETEVHVRLRGEEGMHSECLGASISMGAKCLVHT